MKILVIGGGPVGGYCAYVLSKRGHEVHLYEEHEIIGLPFQCTGILTGSFKGIIDIPEKVIKNRISNVEIVPPSKKVLRLALKEEELVLDRTLFDQHVVSKAIEAGTKVHTGARFVGIEKGKALIRTKGNFVHEDFDFLIGADGPKSKVREIINPAGKKDIVQYYIGAQATIKYKEERDTYRAFFGSRYKDFFGWSVPEAKGYARVGTALRDNPRELLEEMIQGVVEDRQGGLIPIYNPNLIVKKGNIAIVGDAATHVKATTGGGIIPGMKAAIEIAGLVKDNSTYKNRDLKVHKELRMHLFLRRVLNDFSDRDYDRLIKIASRRRVKRILEKKSRDDSASFILDLMFREPRLFLFGLKGFTCMIGMMWRREI